MRKGLRPEGGCIVDGSRERLEENKVARWMKSGKGDWERRKLAI